MRAKVAAAKQRHLGVESLRCERASCGGASAAPHWPFVVAAPVVDYNAILSKANAVWSAKVNGVRNYVSKLQKAQRAAMSKLQNMRPSARARLFLSK